MAECSGEERGRSVLEKARSDLEKNLKLKLSPLDFIYANRMCQKSVNSFKSNILRRHNSKLDKLGLRTDLESDPNKIVTNISDKILNKDEMRILALGLDFKLPIFRLDFHGYFLIFEKALHSLNELLPLPTSKYNVKNEFKHLSNKFFFKFNKFKNFCPVLSYNDLKIFRSLKKDKSIIISKPDKGSGVVIMNRNDYITKMKQLLSDTTKFKKLNTNVFKYVLKLEDRINTFLRSLSSRNILTE